MSPNSQSLVLVSQRPLSDCPAYSAEVLGWQSVLELLYLDPQIPAAAPALSLALRASVTSRAGPAGLGQARQGQVLRGTYAWHPPPQC